MSDNPDADQRRPTGRPSSYQAVYAEQARKLAQLGATDVELADFFETTGRTIKRWRTTYPDFAEACRVGKAVADERVVSSLYHRAVGYSFEAEEVFCQKGVIIRADVVKHMPPDTTACIFWLKNRDRENWRDKVDVGSKVGLTVTIAGADADL